MSFKLCMMLPVLICFSAGCKERSLVSDAKAEPASPEARYSAGDEVESHVLAKQGEVMQAARTSVNPNVVLNWETLQCIGATASSGTCMIEGNLGAPNSSVTFTINVKQPESASCNYDVVTFEVAELSSEC